MAKVRVYELAKELGVDSKTVLAEAKDLGEFVRSASSTLEAPVVRRLREKLTTGAEPAKKPAPAGATARSGPASVAVGRQSPTPTAPSTGSPAGRPAAPPATEAPAARTSPAAGDGSNGSATTARPGAGAVPRTPGQPVPGPRTPTAGNGSAAPAAEAARGRATPETTRADRETHPGRPGDHPGRQ